MRKFNITVDGRKYLVEVEEVGALSAATPVEAPVVAQQAAPVAKAAEVNVQGAKVVAPMPGMIIDFKVASGTTVKKGQPILILEAMKMENDVVAPSDGVVTFNVAKGATVETGAVIAVIA